MQYSYFDLKPQLGDDVFVADGAKLIGDCRLADKVNVWFNTVIRADVNYVHIGANTNVQDLSMLHVTEKHPLYIDENVTIGHSVTLHGCSIGKNSLIGMGATILDGVKIGDFCIVAAGSVVPPGKIYPDHSLILGSPASVKKEISDEQQKWLDKHYLSYLKYAQNFMSHSKSLS